MDADDESLKPKFAEWPPKELDSLSVDALSAYRDQLEAELDLTRKNLHEAEAENLQRRAKRSRPEMLRGTTRRLETPLGTLYVTIT